MLFTSAWRTSCAMKLAGRGLGGCGMRYGFFVLDLWLGFRCLDGGSGSLDWNSIVASIASYEP